MQLEINVWIKMTSSQAQFKPDFFKLQKIFNYYQYQPYF